MNQKGISSILIILIIIGVLVIGGGIYWWQSEGKLTKAEKCYKNLSSLGKSGTPSMPDPAAYFCTCMGGKFTIEKTDSGGEKGLCRIEGKAYGDWDYFCEKNKEDNVYANCRSYQPKSQDETADWQTYRNDEYGFEVKYPTEIIFPQDIWVRISFAGPESTLIKGGSPIKLNFSEITQIIQEKILFLGGIPIVDLIFEIQEKASDFSGLENYLREKVKEDREFISKNPPAAGLMIYDPKKIKIGNLDGFELKSQGLSVMANTSAELYFEKPDFISIIRYSYSATYLSEGFEDVSEAQNERLKYEIIEKILSTFKFISQ